MKCKLIKLTNFSGKKASIYTIKIDNEGITLFDKFIEENIISFKSELQNILIRLNTIGNKTGAREDFFKQYEGNLGDGVCALYDEPDSHLRLYCIRYGSQIIVLGGGGHKPKSIRKFQEDSKLKKENYLLREISKNITDRINNEITFSTDGYDFEGDLEFDIYE